ncbi:MAG: SpoIIE family protein phosphatase [Ferruginibacter sp.]|nr:SpoIIE family protein phosphatase [Ferruginibacter sp.]
MDNLLFESQLVTDRSQLAFLKREIHNLVKEKFSETRTGEIDIVVAEMLSNLIKYAGGGELLYRLCRHEEDNLFEVLCIDNGPGIKDVGFSSRDGVSTNNSLGQGLGAIARLSDFSQLYSQPGWGTIIYSRFTSNQQKGPTNKPSKLVVRCINVALPGQVVCGDGAAVRFLEDKVMILAADGLGHGPHAKDAVDQAIKAFRGTMSCDPAELVKEIHVEIKKSRGLVGTLAVINFDSKTWEVCGIGNIHTRLQKGLENRNYISNNGIIGVNIPTRLENTIWDLEKFQMMIFCSDGIKTKWDLVKYPSILKYDPMIIAAAIYKDHARRTDDMTVLIVKVT